MSNPWQVDIVYGSVPGEIVISLHHLCTQQKRGTANCRKSMRILIGQGRLLFAISLVVFGLQHLIYANSAGGPVPGFPWIPGKTQVACLIGVVLIVAGVNIAFAKFLRPTAAVLGMILLLYVLVVHAPRLAAKPHDPNRWTPTFEMLAMCGGALVLAGTERVEKAQSRGWEILDKAVQGGPLLFALPMVVFGIQHFMYARFVAGLVPSWIPGHLFWAYFVGVAFFAATAAIVTRHQERLAATLLGLMFFLWVLLLHLPRVAAAPGNGNEWTSAFVALVLSGGALVLAGTYVGENGTTSAIVSVERSG
jgi:uncharacterized membrane protein YphA (DoxX/SURF4 family)